MYIADVALERRRDGVLEGAQSSGTRVCRFICLVLGIEEGIGLLHGNVDGQNVTR